MKTKKVCLDSLGVSPKCSLIDCALSFLEDGFSFDSIEELTGIRQAELKRVVNNGGYELYKGSNNSGISWKNNIRQWNSYKLSNGYY